LKPILHWPAVAALTLLSGLAAPSHAVVYDCKALPVEGSQPYAYPTAINNKLQVSGNSTFSDGRSGAALWKGKRTLVDLNSTLQGPLWGSWASDLNDRGQVVGEASYRCGEFCERRRAILWQDGVPSELPLLPDAYSSLARSINNKGRVVGDMGLSGARHAVLWRDGRAIDLGALGDRPADTYSEAMFINDDNVIVGRSNGGPMDFNSHAVIWDAKGRITDLGPLPGGDWAIAMSVNRARTVVGSSNDGADNLTRAAAWQGGQVYDLGMLTPGARSHASAINDQGTVVGGEDMAGTYTALVWPSIHEPPQALKALVGNNCHSKQGYSLDDAVSINADGAIVARGYKVGVGFVAFLLIPR
jgi:probable HAF family extracellular repeat protein